MSNKSVDIGTYLSTTRYNDITNLLIFIIATL